MLILERYQINELISTIFNYLDGQKLSDVRSALTKLGQNTKSDVKKLYQSIPIDPYVEEKLLDTLRVSTQHRKTYRNKPNLLALLTHLHHDGYGYGHLAYLLTLIEDIRYQPYRDFKFATLLAMLVASVTALFHIKPKYFRATLQFISKALPQLLIKWGKAILNLPANITFFGVGYTSAMYIYFLYRTFRYGLSNFYQKLSALLFRTSATALSLAGYVLCFLTAGVASPLTGILFISSSAVDVVESLFNYFTIRFKSLPERTSLEQSWNVLADHTRRESQQRHAGKELTVKLTTALLITAIVGIWCFFPPSIALTLGCFASIGLIGFVKSNILNYIEATHTEKLQSKLQAITHCLNEKTNAEVVESVQTMKPLLAKKPTPSNENGPQCQRNSKSTKSVHFFAPVLRPSNETITPDHTPAFGS